MTLEIRLSHSTMKNCLTYRKLLMYASQLKLHYVNSGMLTNPDCFRFFQFSPTFGFRYAIEPSLLTYQNFTTAIGQAPLDLLVGGGEDRGRFGVVQNGLNRMNCG